MTPPRKMPFTWMEILIAVVVLGVLLLAVGIFILGKTSLSTKEGMLSRMKQLHLATQSMALDGTTTGETNLAWPGTYDGTFPTWAGNIVPSYLSTNDFLRLLSNPHNSRESQTFPIKNTNAILVYGVTEDQDESFVFLTSANFTNTPTGGNPLRPDAKPYGDRGFVIFRKGGDGAYLRPDQAGDTNVIGKFTPLLR